MKEEMSSVDIRYVVRELQWLVGSRVDKIYHDGDEIRIKLRTKEGRADLILQAGKRFHLTSYVKEAPKQPSSFTMLLRKHLSGGFIDAIEQHGFDRIVKIRIGDYTLIGELFRRGNIVLVDSDNKIVAALRYEEYKDRAIKPKAEYRSPPARENPLEVSKERFLELMREDENLELVRALARKLNMGGMYAEEISIRAGFEKTTPVKELSDEDLLRVYEAMLKTFNDEPRPNIVYKEGNMHDVVPIELKIYENLEKRYFNTFSEALDEYFGRITIEKARIRYSTDNLHFEHVEPGHPYPYADGSFDVVTSFEVIEHIPDWSVYLHELARVLAEDGILIMSSPNRPYYRDERGEINAYHVLEFDREELDRILAIHFPYRRLFGQNHYSGILIEDFRSDLVDVDARDVLTGRELDSSHYLIAVCSRRSLPDMEGLCYPATRGNQMREREQQVAFLEQELERARSAYEALAGQFEERGQWALALQQELEELRSRLEEKDG